MDSSIAVVPGVVYGEPFEGEVNLEGSIRTEFESRGPKVISGNDAQALDYGREEVVTPSYYSVLLDDGFDGRVFCEMSASESSFLLSSFAPLQPVYFDWRITPRLPPRLSSSWILFLPRLTYLKSFRSIPCRPPPVHLLKSHVTAQGQEAALLPTRSGPSFTPNLHTHQHQIQPTIIVSSFLSKPTTRGMRLFDRTSG
jgi:hypothetical protein